MAESVLRPDEKAEYQTPVTNFFTDEVRYNSSGTLMLTNTRRLVLVSVRGLIAKEYEVIYSFHMGDITSAGVEKGLLKKTLIITARVLDERGFVTFHHEGVKDPEAWVELINREIHVDQIRESTSQSLAAFLNSRERTTMPEALSILQRAYPEAGTSSALGWIKYLISENMVQGFLDEGKNEFVHISAYKQGTEVPQYVIASSFDLGPNGTLHIKCPHCGTFQELTQKQTTVLCRNCQNTYMVPENILSLL